MKALAGVALIGAAAALASNPILVPISIVSGRRKRSESFSDEDFREQPDTDYVMNMLKENLIKVFAIHADVRNSIVRGRHITVIISFA